MSLFECLKCGKETNNQNQRFFTIPGFIIVPNEYYLCEEHKDLRYSFKDIYNEDGSRKSPPFEPKTYENYTIDLSMPIRETKDIVIACTHEWISLKDKSPSEEILVLIYCGDLFGEPKKIFQARI